MRLVCLWLACGLALLSGAARAEGAVFAWPDSFTARVEILALLQSLNADLLSHDSATLTLERWCGVHRLAAEPRIVARLIRGLVKPPTDAQRALLQAAPGEMVKFRHVQLLCGDHVLSEADNWYVPSRLTPAMNHLLDETDTPFGKAVHDLGFRRHTLSAMLLWSPLPDGWEMESTPPPAAGDVLRIPPHLLEHRAVLTNAAGTPFSLVVETYTGDVLAFPPPGR